MARNQTRLGLVTPVLISISLGWMAVEMLSASSSHVITNPGRMNSQILITPARSTLAFHVFLITLALAPPINIGLLFLTERSGEKPASRLSRRQTMMRCAYAATAVMTMALAGGIAGYTYEMIQARILISREGVFYRASGTEARIRWTDLRSMVLQLRSRSQELELAGNWYRVRIDLIPFSEADRELLVRTLPSAARLRPMKRDDPNRMVWRRQLNPGIRSE